MITPNYVAEMAAYNRWQNDKLFDFCAALSDQERKEDRNMFFGSIHNTLNHILTVDRALYSYLAHGKSPKSERPPPVEDFDELRTVRRELDETLAGWGPSLDDTWFAEKVDFWGGRKVSRGKLVVQLFNHQTHHRSQITTHLNLMGIDYGNTDIPFRPGGEG